MASKPLNTESLLRSAFLKSELEFLKAQPRFAAALDRLKTPDEFARLCDLAEELLKEHEIANPAAKQFRADAPSTNRLPRSK